MTEIEKDRLQEAAKYVRKTFFPRWRNGEHWTVKLIPDFPGQGRCDREAKTVSLQYVSKEDDDLHCLLIHEICHAVTPGDHNKKWRGRMRKAADTAKKLGRESLSKSLLTEVKNYEPGKPIQIDSAFIYQQVRDYVLGNPGASYEQTLKVVTRSWGFYPEELEEDFKRCKEVYEKAARDSLLFGKKQILSEVNENDAGDGINQD